MKQLHFSSAVVAVAAFIAVFTLAQKEAQAATAGKDKSASGAVRASSTVKSGGADVKEAPPAWVVSSTGTVARAEAGDIGAMEEIANGNKDVVKATMGFKRAATLGHKRSAKILEKLQKDSAR